MNKEHMTRKIRIHFGNIKKFAEALQVEPSSVYRYMSKQGKPPKYYEFIFEIMDINKKLREDLKK